MMGGRSLRRQGLFTATKHSTQLYEGTHMIPAFSHEDADAVLHGCIKHSYSGVEVWG